MSARALNAGLYLPNGDGAMGGGSEQLRDVPKMARHAEDAELDSVQAANYFLFSYPDQDPIGRWECGSFLSALATSTSRVAIGPLVRCMSIRSPALLARIAETADETSNGRLNLLVGAGWQTAENGAFAFPFAHLVSRFEEGFQIVHDQMKTAEDGSFDLHTGVSSTDHGEQRRRRRVGCAQVACH